MSYARFFYTLLLLLAAPFIVLRLLWRARRQPAYLRHIGERFGFYAARPQAPVIWLHAVSVGETRAAEPLISALRQRFPKHAILLTHMTPTGRETGAQIYDDQVTRCYLPYDYPFAVKRFLAHFRPRLGLLLETELWPNLIFACHARQIPIALVNARLSEKSARGYQRVSRLTRETLGRLDRVCAQTDADAQRLTHLGAQDVQILGNLKFDISPPQSAQAQANALRAQLGQRLVLLLASTREGEESLLLDAFKRCAAPRPLLLIVPRHPQRFEAVANLISAHGLKLQRRSANETIRADTDVVLGDSMGEMFGFYGAADLAFIGGSLLPLGGQNLIEACAMGIPTLVGPHTFNFEQATQQSIAIGATLRVADADALFSAASRLLADDLGRAQMGANGRRFWLQNQGATQSTLAALAPFLAADVSLTINP